MKKLNVAVCGAAGYSGQELLRLLARHGGANVKFITSESQKGQKVSDVLPKLTEYEDLKFCSLEDDKLYKKGAVDFAFLCLPHEPSAYSAKRFLDAGVRVIDLSGAYRIEDLDVFEKFYRFKHPYPELIRDAVFGLPEIHFDRIKDARLIANPGCFVSSVLLPLIPPVQAGLIDASDIIANSVSGFSGRGKRMDLPGLFVEQNENFYAYGIGIHRHRPEMLQELSRHTDQKVGLTFTPHVIPADRGICSTIYLSGKEGDLEKCLNELENFYSNSPFITIYKDKIPQLKWITGTNKVAIGGGFDRETGKIVLISCLDNLTKGASGMAVQNFNLMGDFEPTEGLL